MKAGVVYVNQAGRSRNVPPDIRRAIDPRLEVVVVSDPWQWSKRWDFYITRANLHHKTESAAAEMGVPIVNMPEGAEYLACEVLKRASVGEDVWLWNPSKTGDRP